MFLPYTYIFTARKSMTATPKRKTLDYSEEQSSSKKKRKKADEEEQTDHVEVSTIFYRWYRSIFVFLNMLASTDLPHRPIQGRN